MASYALRLGDSDVKKVWGGQTRLRTHYASQKVRVAAMQMAEKKVWAQRS
jgi:hypothetical protein